MLNQIENVYNFNVKQLEVDRNNIFQMSFSWTNNFVSTQPPLINEVKNMSSESKDFDPMNWLTTNVQPQTNEFIDNFQLLGNLKPVETKYNSILYSVDALRIRDKQPCRLTFPSTKLINKLKGNVDLTTEKVKEGRTTKKIVTAMNVTLRYKIKDNEFINVQIKDVLPYDKSKSEVK